MDEWDKANPGATPDQRKKYERTIRTSAEAMGSRTGLSGEKSESQLDAWRQKMEAAVQRKLEERLPGGLIPAADADPAEPDDPTGVEALEAVGVGRLRAADEEEFAGGRRHRHRRYRGGALIVGSVMNFAKEVATGIGRYLQARVKGPVERRAFSVVITGLQVADQGLATSVGFVTAAGGLIQFLLGTTKNALKNISSTTAAVEDWLTNGNNQKAVADGITTNLASTIAVSIVALVQAKIVSVSFVVAVMLKMLGAGVSGHGRAAATTAFYLWYTQQDNATKLSIKQQAAAWAMSAAMAAPGAAMAVAAAAPGAAGAAKTAAEALYGIVKNGLGVAVVAAKRTGYAAAAVSKVTWTAAAQALHAAADLKTAIAEAALLLAGGAAGERVGGADVAADAAAVAVQAPINQAAAAAAGAQVIALAGVEREAAAEVVAAPPGPGPAPPPAPPQIPAAPSGPAEAAVVQGVAAAAPEGPGEPPMDVGAAPRRRPAGSMDEEAPEGPPRAGRRRLTSRRLRRSSAPRRTRRSSSGRRRGYSRRRRE